MTEREYRDDYGTCSRTYASLVLRSWTRHWSEVTTLLGVTPDRTQDASPRIERGRGQAARAAKMNTWLLDSKPEVESRDFRRHLDALLACVSRRAAELQRLREDGWQTEVSVYWLSRTGHGGPSLWPEQAALLGQLGLELWFDVYFDDSPESHEPLVPGKLTDNFMRASRHWRRFGFGRRGSLPPGPS